MTDYMFGSTRRLRLGERDVLQLPIVVARVENENWCGDVLKAALSEEALGVESGRERRYAGGIELGGRPCGVRCEV